MNTLSARGQQRKDGAPNPTATHRGCCAQEPSVVGDTLGLALGDALGLALGDAEGKILGLVLGDAEGDTLGLTLGDALGIALGDAEGEILGLVLGNTEGDTDGLVEPAASIVIVAGRLSTTADLSAGGPESRRSSTNASLVSATRSCAVMWATTDT